MGPEQGNKVEIHQHTVLTFCVEESEQINYLKRD